MNFISYTKIFHCLRGVADKVSAIDLQQVSETSQLSDTKQTESILLQVADGMVDGVHSTDLGMQQYADSYLKKIREILHEKNEGPTSCIPCKQQRDSYDWYARH